MEDNSHHIKNWSASDQPRERLLAKGASSLSDVELLTILIGTGIKGCSAMDLARKLLALSNNSMQELGQKSPRAIMSLVKGIGPAKAINICTALELGRRQQVHTSPEKVRYLSSMSLSKVLQARIGHLDTESFYVLYLNAANNIIAEKELFVGGMSSTIVDVRVIVRQALELKAVSIVCGHNHPSGSIVPSNADIRITIKILKACELLDIRLLDHIIVTTDNKYYSFRDEDKMGEGNT